MHDQTHRQKNQYPILVPDNGAKNLIGPLVHGAIIVFQGRSNRD